MRVSVRVIHGENFWEFIVKISSIFSTREQQTSKFLYLIQEYGFVQSILRFINE